jgi:YD repeat-containing protein
MSNCRGCGSVLDPTQEEVNQAVDNILVASLEDAKKHGEICPLCGHSQAQPVSNRKSVQFALLLAALLIASGLAVAYYMHRDTERQAAAQEALKQAESNTAITQLLGGSLSIHGKITGEVKQDETGWHEVQLNIPIHGPKGDGTVLVSGGRENGSWKFTTFEVLMPQAKEKADLITGRIVEYSPDAYVDIHTQATGVPDYLLTNVPSPQWDGDFPCVYALASVSAGPQVGSCSTPLPMSRTSRTPVDRFETDLRTGKFIMRQTDLSISEAGFEIPLTRTYATQDWVPPNQSHAFGLNANHPYDIAPCGTRNPYTEQFILLEDGDFLYFPRVSRGTGYADAIYRHSETGASFYKAIQKWDGTGWLLDLQDGSTIHFPESYSAKNLAQGAPTEMVDSAGKKIQLIRDPKRNLREIRAPDGASIRLAYDDHDRIVRAEDSQGHWTTYRYDSSGFLTSVNNSAGAARYYFYEGGLLTWIRDQQKRMLVHNSYAKDWLVRQQFGNGETIRYDYDLSRNKVYAERATLTLPDGSVRTLQTGNSVSAVYKRMK